MKRIAMFLGGLLILPAFGEVAPVFYDDYDIEYIDTDYADPDDILIDMEEENPVAEAPKTPIKVSRQQTVSRNIANRSTASRAIPSSQSSSATSARGKSTGNSARAVAARTTTNASPRTTSSRAVSSRTATTGATRAAATRATGGSTRTTTARTGTVASGVKKTTTSAARTATASSGARVSRAATSSARIKNITGTGTADGSKSLYIGFDSGRVGIRSSSTGRSPVIRSAATTGLSTTETAIVATDTSEMDELAELTDYCKAQYMACMDNYCNVLDENQGRCSCSANLKNYAKSEAALKQATEELQEVAQKIQYIGLSAREVETLFTQTEAEQTMQTKTDTTQLKTSLDKVKDMIIEARSGNATSSSSGLNFDVSGLLDFTIDSTGFDLSSFLGGFMGSGNTVSNQRGEELFKTATNRCKANVLRSCTAQGVDASTITNAYDLEIDKECIAYEKSLNESNDEMAATVRNAKNVLQKARLMVAQSKNEYDMRGCINALDACMQDEFVCGSDYENCLDPTGRYIVNGEIVVGSQPGHAIDPALAATVGSVMTSDVCDINLYRTWDFSTGSCQGYSSTYTSPSDQYNAWGAGTNDTLTNYINATVTDTAARNSSVNMSEYLQNKIGYVSGNNSDRKNYGMCVGVLNKCQDYTYTGTGTNSTYNPKNDVIKQYLGRVLIQIKAKQDEVLSEYAESCINDVQSCLAQNGYPTEEPLDESGNSQWTGTEQTQANIAINACRATVVTCMSVNGYSIATPTPDEMNCWVMGLQFNTLTSECESVGGGTGTGGGGNGGGGGTSYTVSFSCGQGTGSVSSQTTTGSITLPSIGCTRTGYTLSGWSCGALGASYAPSGNVTCTAQWTQSGNDTQYTFSYNCNTCTSKTGSTSGNVPLSSNSTVTLSNYCTAPSGSTISWNCGNKITTSNTFTLTGTTSCTATCSTSPSTQYTLNYTCSADCAKQTGTATVSGTSVNLNNYCVGTGQTATWKCGGASVSNPESYSFTASTTNCTATCTTTPLENDSYESQWTKAAGDITVETLGDN